MNINILKNLIELAPDGATHYDSEPTYYKSSPDKFYIWEEDDKFWCPVINIEPTGGFEMNSLEDIRTIIELYEQLNYAMEIIEDTDPDSWDKSSIIETLARFSNE